MSDLNRMMWKSWWHTKGFELFWILVAVIAWVALIVWASGIGAERMAG